MLISAGRMGMRTDDDKQALWVFGYGSLMWRPGFPFETRVPAKLHGHHRALCVYSILHRGTSENPGLVLGLDHGGDCHGVAFRVPAGAENDTIAYLRERCERSSPTPGPWRRPMSPGSRSPRPTASTTGGSRPCTPSTAP